jgi:MFS transporter, DHA2 family, multidrug resistance protein
MLGYLVFGDSNTMAQIAFLALCGMGIGSCLTASSTLVMSNVSEDRAGMAGSVEGVAYEFGGGFGVTIFGSLMTAVYVSHVRNHGIDAMAGSSLDEALAYAMQHSESQAMLSRAMQAFESSFTAVSSIVIATLFVLSMVVLAVNHRVLKNT